MLDSILGDYQVTDLPEEKLEVLEPVSTALKQRHYCSNIIHNFPSYRLILDWYPTTELPVC
mgnify:CR=1 FL=1